MPNDSSNRLPVSNQLWAAVARFPWLELESLTHRDPGGRGLASFLRAGKPLDAGALREAALELAAHARAVVIITGFPIVLANRVTAETDGPPGALYLAEVLVSLGVSVAIVTDPVAVPILQAGAACVGLDPGIVQACPLPICSASSAECERWLAEFMHRSGEPWSHLIAIERPGPSHTVESFQGQQRDVPIPLDAFQTAVPEVDRDRYHNMRGEPLDAYVAPTHRLFERICEEKLPIKSIAIGDGGNELGMGRFLWEDLVAAIGMGPAGNIACRVAADIALLAGTSNWGGYALALAVANLCGQKLTSPWLQPAGQQLLLETLVAAGAVDGRTRLAEPTVDGLTSKDYLSTLAEMIKLVETAI
jgi:hypothetical protein